MMKDFGENWNNTVVNVDKYYRRECGPVDTAGHMDALRSRGCWIGSTGALLFHFLLQKAISVRVHGPLN